MPTYGNTSGDADCESAGRTVFIGNVGLAAFEEPDKGLAGPATAMLTIDVISTPGSSSWKFHFVTLELALEAPPAARFVDHSGRQNYHREVLADPAAAINADPDLLYWAESDDPATVIRIREDETALLSGPSTGRTYYVGIAGFGPDTDALRLTAVAAGSLVRETSCHLVIDQLRLGDRLAGHLD
jgi:hypothetical protein